MDLSEDPPDTADSKAFGTFQDQDYEPKDLIQVFPFKIIKLRIECHFSGPTCTRNAFTLIEIDHTVT